KSTSPARGAVSRGPIFASETRLTLTHEIFEVMPLDIVRQVADVDSTVLLRVLTYARHDLLFARPILEATRRSTTARTVRVRVASRRTGVGERSSRATIAIGVTAARATARRV